MPEGEPFQVPRVLLDTVVSMTTPRPAWTITEAAKRTGASDSTLRRYRAAGKFPGAYKDSTGAWRFPHEDLIAAGLSFSTPLGEPSTDQGVNEVSDQPLNSQAEQVAQLEQALREERARADNAERLAASYRENLNDVRLALRMLEAGTSQPQSVSDQPSVISQTKVTEQANDQPPKPTLWQRIRGALATR